LGLFLSLEYQLLPICDRKLQLKEVIQYLYFSVKGININFIALNLTGFICLSIYCTVGYLDHSHFYGIGNIHIEDIAFAYHAAILTLVVVLQYFIYPVGNNKLSKGYLVLLSTIWTLIPIFLYITLQGDTLLQLHLMK